MLRGDSVELNRDAAVLSRSDTEALIAIDPAAEPLPREPPPPTDAPTAEEPSAARIAPHIPRYANVPESAQWPAGPYRQAPAEFGGEWWLTNPFTGEQPWLTQTGGAGESLPRPAQEIPEAPADFIELFGPPPQANAGTHRLHQSTAMAQWLIDLQHFQGSGLPDGFTQEQADKAGDLFEHWGLGRPVYYEGRYGWKARFPDSGIPGFEASPFTAIEAPHLVVAQYQVSMSQQGMPPAERHPFVPPGAWES